MGNRVQGGPTNGGPFETRHSRQDFLFLGGGVLADTVLAACGSSGSTSTTTTTAPPGPTTATYRSRPDLKPPLIDVTRGSDSPAGGLGGKKSDFTPCSGASFAGQHDARTHAGGTITLFDDEVTRRRPSGRAGLVLDVDEAKRTATMQTQYFHPDGRLVAGSQGSFQVLPNTNVLIGWAADPYYTELQADGTLVLDGGSSQVPHTGLFPGLPLRVDRPTGRSAGRCGGPFRIPGSGLGVLERFDRDGAVAPAGRAGPRQPPDGRGGPTPGSRVLDQRLSAGSALATDPFASPQAVLPASRACNSGLTTLPVGFRGRASTKTNWRGTL